ncbi:conjugal transfer protein TraG [Hellea sp.]|nr:conjugal transfer protein TraG [Hellea sp.]
MSPNSILIGQVGVVFTTIGAGVWGATQWVATELRFDPYLGKPWFQFNEMPVYYPWRLFEWWYAFEPYAPEVFARGGQIAIGASFLGVVFSVIGSVWRGRQAKKLTTFGSSRWADDKDLKQATLFDQDGVFIGRTDKNYLRHSGPEHVMTFAPTRSGKGVGLVIPTLLSWPHSTVVHDIKGENWQVTSGYRSTFSHCLLFDPTNPASAKYNPLLEVRKGRNEVRDVQNIADILVDPEGALERRSHWEKTAHALLVGAILHVLYAENEKTLAKVATFLSDPARTFEQTLIGMMSTNHLGRSDAATPSVHPVVAQASRELLNKSENERSGVLSTAMSFLGLYRDPTVAEVTSSCDWRIEDLVNAVKPVSLYLVVPPSDISRTKPLVRLILNQIGRRLTEKLDGEIDGNARRQVLLMLDEFPALGRLEFFESALAFMAGYGLRAFLITQSLNQIEKAYGPNNSILDNCHVRVAFATNDERTAKRISDALGTTTEMRAMRNYAGHRLAPWLSHVMVSRQETARQLLTPGEVMQLPSDEEIVLVSGVPPIRATKIRYYADKNFSDRVCSPPILNGSNHPYGDSPPGRFDDWSGLTAKVHQNLMDAMKTKTSSKTTPTSGGKEQARNLDERHRPPKEPAEEVAKDDIDLDGQSEVALPGELARTTDVLDRATPGQDLMGYGR